MVVREMNSHNMVEIGDRNAVVVRHGDEDGLLYCLDAEDGRSKVLGTCFRGVIDVEHQLFQRQRELNWGNARTGHS
jgi:hypothetical protein